MKKLTRLLALVLVVMMLSAFLGAFSAHAAGQRKILISHFNQDDVYSNASVIFTKAYMDANGYSTLSDVTRAYNAKVSEKIQAIGRREETAPTINSPASSRCRLPGMKTTVITR